MGKVASAQLHHGNVQGDPDVSYSSLIFLGRFSPLFGHFPMTEAFFFDPCCNLQKLRQQCCATRLFPMGCLARSQERNLRMMTVISRLDFLDVTCVFSCEILLFLEARNYTSSSDFYVYVICML